MLYAERNRPYRAGMDPEPEEMQPFSVRCEPRLWASVKTIARRRGESIGVVIRRALIEYEEADALRAQRIPHAS